jgi:ethylmalonyl-CoA/methylmalonyl-CoA decarboxylase
MALAMGEVLDALAALPITSIAAIEGPAIGGGAEVAVTADFRFMGANSALHFVHTRLGVVPGWGGAGRLVDRVGRDRALRILLEAERMDAGRCAALGLAEVVGPGDALPTALALAARIARRGAAARAAKAAIVARGTRTAEQREAEAEAFASVWGAELHRAALARVLESLG